MRAGFYDVEKLYRESASPLEFLSTIAELCNNDDEILRWISSKPREYIITAVKSVMEPCRCRSAWEVRHELLGYNGQVGGVVSRKKRSALRSDGADHDGRAQDVPRPAGKPQKLVEIIGTDQQEFYHNLKLAVTSVVSCGVKRIFAVVSDHQCGKTVMAEHLVRDLTLACIPSITMQTLSANTEITNHGSYQVIVVDNADILLANPIVENTFRTFYERHTTVFVFFCRISSPIQHLLSAYHAFILNPPKLGFDTEVQVVQNSLGGADIIDLDTVTRLMRMIRATGGNSVITRAQTIASVLLCERNDNAPLHVSDETIRKTMSRYVSTLYLTSDRIHALPDKLTQRIIGQDPVIQAITPYLTSIASGLTDPERPLGVFFFFGPTGTGKSQLARVIADVLFDGNYHKEDMNLFKERHTVSRILGAPPGYNGHDNVPSILQFAADKPHGVIVFDEVEKAHPDVLEALMELLDTAKLRGSNGRMYDFSRILFILTSNVTAEGKKDRVIGGFSELPSETDLSPREKVRASGMFKASFIGRVNCFGEFSKLDESHLSYIARLMLDAMRRRLADNGYDTGDLSGFIPEVVAAYDADDGGRSMERHCRSIVLEKIIFDRYQGIDCGKTIEAGS